MQEFLLNFVHTIVYQVKDQIKCKLLVLSRRLFHLADDGSQIRWMGSLTGISELKQIKLSVIVEYNMSSNCFFNQATSEGSADKSIIKASVQPLHC